MVKLENRQIVHLVSEIIVISTVIYWFQKKTNDFAIQLNNMSKKLEEQSLVINRHEQMISQLVGLVDTLSRGNLLATPNHPKQMLATPNQPKQMLATPNHPKQRVSFDDDDHKPQHKSKSKSKQQKVLDEDDEPLPVHKPKNKQVEEPDEDEYSETESDIDREIQDEIEELDLKKQPQ
jgi:hypothetical protein